MSINTILLPSDLNIRKCKDFFKLKYSYNVNYDFFNSHFNRLDYFRFNKPKKDICKFCDLNNNLIQKNRGIENERLKK